MGNGKSEGKRLIVARRKEEPEEEMRGGGGEGARGKEYCHVIQPLQTLASGYALAVTTDAEPARRGIPNETGAPREIQSPALRTYYRFSVMDKRAECLEHFLTQNTGENGSQGSMVGILASGFPLGTVNSR